MSYLDLSISEIHEALVKGETTPLELTKEAIARAKSDNNNAFETICEKEALEFAENLKEVETDNVFWGIPFLAKDNFSTKGIETTASSNILNGYVPLFDAHVIKALKDKKAVLIGKTTLDELAMGGTGTTGHKGMTYNPYDESKTRLVGGSSCGSAAAVAASIVPFALGSDTGDSVRKPASYAGLVGFKPTWSRISRFGLFPFAPSLDHVAYFTRNVKDAALALEVLAGRCEKDSTSSLKPVEQYSKHLNDSISGKKVAVLKEITDSITDSKIIEKFDKSVEALRNAGAIVDYVEFGRESLASLYATYMVISCAEATSNNANLDGIKFGPYYEGKSYQEVMYQARTKGFSELIKRRFVIGSYCLMKENQEELFLAAQRNRAKIVKRTNDILANYDFIYVPAAPSVAPKKDAKSDKLSDEYLIADNHLALGNFAGLPSITIPLFLENGLPVGVNVMGRAFEESAVLSMAAALENITGLNGLSVKNKKEGNL